MTLRGFQQSTRKRVNAEVARLNAELTRHYRIARDEIQAQLDALYLRALADASPENYYAILIQTRRLTTLLAQVDRAYTRASTAAATTITDASRLAMVNTYYYNSYALVGPSAVQGVSFGFNQLPEELVNLAVTGTSETFRGLNTRFGMMQDYAPQHGTLADIIVNRRTQDLRRVQDTLVQMFIQGKGVTQTARALDRSIAIGRNNAERIVRTEAHRTAMLGHYAATQSARAAGVEVKRMIVSVLDDRTRPQSVQVDGEVEGDDGRFEYPGGARVLIPGNSGVAAWDINDREGVVDVVDEVPPETRRMRIPGDRPSAAEREALRSRGLPIPGETYIVEWQGFERWAAANGLARNRYGQLVGAEAARAE